jgi:hypothetical protein
MKKDETICTIHLIVEKELSNACRDKYLCINGNTFVEKKASFEVNFPSMLEVLTCDPMMQT